MTIISILLDSGKANVIPFATTAMVHYNATVEFSEMGYFITVTFKDIKPEKVNALLKRYGLKR